MTAIFGRNIGIQNDATALNNQTIKQLRQKANDLKNSRLSAFP